ncbi:predicted GPI-anchored protein 58 [Thalassophryne amazonica]|uniref:predicted GPI-anchored protein 58 n=1 Tax=Thalassophryne amazonica TaxID=390379 RepID=UPI0014725A71|nr:predicted GPI-anchored protein 58 [Thalassophryne amazonica]
MQAPSRAPPKSAPRTTHVASTRSLRTEAEPASSCPTSQRLRATTTAVLSLPPVPAPRQPCAPVPPKTVCFAPAAAPVSTPAAPATLPAGPVSMRTAPATGAISAPAAPPAEPVSVRITPAVAPDSTPAAPAATPVSMPAAPATLPAGPVSMCTAPATGAISAPAAPPAEPVSVRITPAVAPDSTPAAPAAAPVSTPAAPATLPASPVSMRNAPATGAISAPAAPATAPGSTPTAALDFARTAPAPVPAHAAPQPVSRPDGASFARMPSEPSPPAPPHPAPASLPAQKMTIEDANLEMVSDILLELYLLRVYFVLTLFTSVLCWFKAPRLLLGGPCLTLPQFQSVMTWLLVPGM